MKLFRLTLLFLFLLSCSILHAQDRDPDSFTFTGHTDSLSRAARSAPQRFLFGWGTGASPVDVQVSRDLHINAAIFSYNTGFHEESVYIPHYLSELPDSSRLMMGTQGINDDTYYNAIAMEFDPTLGSIGDINSFKPRKYDTTAAVFGFTYRNSIGLIPHDSVMTTPNTTAFLLELRKNYNRYLLFADSVTGAPVKVLSGVQPDSLLFAPVLSDAYDIHQALWLAGKKNMFVTDPHRLTTNLTNPANPAKTLPWLDTLTRGGDTTMFRMRGDSTEWYLTLNVRRWPTQFQDNVSDTMKVLSLRVPLRIRLDTITYTGGGTVTATHRGTTEQIIYATFDSVAVQGDTLQRATGLMDHTLSGANTSTWYITKGMLLPFNRLPSPDITLSAHFWLPRLNILSRLNIKEIPELMDGTIPRFICLYDNSSSGTHIDTVVLGVDLEVFYHGNVDIALDFCRFEDRAARAIFRHTKDSLFNAAAQRMYTYLDTTDEAAAHGMSIYRHYFSDETSMPYWRTMRYVQFLLEKSLTHEDGWFYAPHEQHLWQRTEQYKAWPGFAGAAPFFRYGAVGGDDTLQRFDAMSFRAMDLIQGYRGAWQWHNISTPPRLWHHFSDTSLAFDYEVGRAPELKDTSLYDASESDYLRMMGGPYDNGNVHYGFAQAVLESSMYIQFHRNAAALYERTLWAQIFLTCNGTMTPVNPAARSWLGLPTNFRQAHMPGRAKTGEEVRFTTRSALLLGAKGLSYYMGGSIYRDSADFEFGLTRKGRTDYSSFARTDTSEGGDFLDSADKLMQHILIDSIAHFMGIQTNRFYVGGASQLQEVRKAHDWAYDNSPELLRLQLQAVYNKGYRLLTSRRDTSVHLERYLDTALTASDSKFNVKRIHTRTGAAWTGAAEPFKDSAFFMVTLLKDTAVSADTLYYIGLLNRRTDPTIYYPAVAPFGGGTDLGDSVKFFSTVEFDSLSHGIFLSGYSKPDYAQYGARQFTLPLKAPQQTDGYTLFRVREVGGTLDTIMSQSQANSFTVRMKPGEGKLFRVKVLYPGTIPEGHLAYNGQRKMVVAPDLDDSAKVRYHIVYDRIENDRNEVFYRRSKALSATSDESNIVWEPEWPVSVNVSEPIPGTVFAIPFHGDRAYPSIVLRSDSATGAQRVYITYACKNGNHDIAIVQNIFPDDHTGDPFPTGPEFARVVAHVAGTDLSRWGTPVLNASERGNFLVWSDSTLGIVAAYQHPNSYSFLDTLRLCWQAGDSCEHPSVNTYSRASAFTNSASVVWQENQQIYYSIMKADTSDQMQSVHLPFIADAANTDTTIIRLSDSLCTFTNRMPVLYNSLEGNYSYAYINALMCSRVFWEGHSRASPGYSKIYHRNLDILTSLFLLGGTTGAASLVQSIWNGHSDLMQPEVSNGISRDYPIPGNTGHNISDSAFILNLVLRSLPEAPGDTLIFHFPLNYWSKFLNQKSSIDIDGGEPSVASTGWYPHLAAAPEVNSIFSWHLSRRVFEQGSTPRITSSVQYFYRRERTEESITPMPGFRKIPGDGGGGGSDCSAYMIADPYVGESPLSFASIAPFFGGDSLHPLTKMYPDTIRTDWFPIGSVSTVSFYGMGSDTSFVKMDLVKRSDSSRQRISLEATPDTAAKLMVYTFTNGGGSDYRLEFLHTDSTSSYTEDILIGQLPIIDSGGHAGFARRERSEETGKVMNLAHGCSDRSMGLHALVYPNPAQEEIYISPYHVYGSEELRGTRQAESVRVRIVSALGEEVGRFESVTGESVKFSTGSLPSGVYCVRVEGAQENAMTSFVVRR